MHRLEIFRAKDEVYYPNCDFCGRLGIGSCIYKCRVCDLNLHYECGGKSIFEPKDHHDHSFINFKPTLYTCDACGIDQDTKRISCVCSVCQLQVHPYCLQIFPLSVRNIKHSHHKLKLCYSFEIEFDFTNRFCKICSLKMNSVLCLYQCVGGCDYIAHATCATDKNYLIDHEETTDRGSDDLVVEAVEQNERQTEQQQQEFITHFSHPHSLIFSDILPKKEDGDDDLSALCYGCVRPISVPFYTCDSEQCGFFLHKKCFELPKTIQGPIHLHPLALKDFSDLTMGEIVFSGYTCEACWVKCNGFVYYCAKCDASFDVECALFEATLNHESHKCTLSLVSTKYDDGNRCIACGSKFKDAFWCGECNFFLDLKCASLPSTLGHDCPTGTVWSTKPLKLTFDSIFNARGQYYCDLCGETREKYDWFYHCGDCHDSIHTQCLLGDAKFMYGKSYNLDGHCHAVLVVKKPKTDILCDTCEKPCNDSTVVFCPTCKVYFHADFDCCSMDRYLKMPIKNYCCDMSSSTVKDEENEDDRDITGVYHFSHPHSLLIGEYDQAERLLMVACDGCAMPIFAPFYTCADKSCNFLLHADGTLAHESHQCTLALINRNREHSDGAGDRKCSACYSDCSSYRCVCEECDFDIGLQCALLPKVILHRCRSYKYKKRPQHIRYGSSSEGECRVCEDPLSENEWYYYCEDCKETTHVRCTTGIKNNLIKRGAVYRAYNHFHKLIAMYIIDYQGCRVCQNSMGKLEPGLYCAECKNYYHFQCCRRLRRVLQASPVGGSDHSSFGGSESPRDPYSDSDSD